MKSARAAAISDPRIAAVVAALGLGAARVTALAGGLSNAAFHLAGDGRDVVLRIAGPQAPRLGAAPASEIAMQRLAAGAGLAPEILLAWPERGVLVTRYVAGHRPGPEELRDPGMLRRIGRWFRSLHELALPPGFAPIDFCARAAGYLATLRGSRGTPALAAIAERLAARCAATGPPRTLVPCHHDVHHGNLAFDGAAIVALDWEYAGPGDAAADLAAHAGYQVLDAGQVETLLAGYGAGAELRRRVAEFDWIFDCLWYGWLGVAALEGLADGSAERNALEARLLR